LWIISWLGPVSIAIEGVVGCGLSVDLDLFQLQLKELWVVGYQLAWTRFNCN
jgi:hypothetical protein